MGITPEDPGLPYKALHIPHPAGPGNPVKQAMLLFPVCR